MLKRTDAAPECFIAVLISSVPFTSASTASVAVCNSAPDDHSRAAWAGAGDTKSIISGRAASRYFNLLFLTGFIPLEIRLVRKSAKILSFLSLTGFIIFQILFLQKSRPRSEEHTSELQ